MIHAQKDPKLPPAIELAEDWTTALTALTPSQGLALLAILRTLCPHDKLSSAVYQRAALKIDSIAEVQADLAGLIRAIEAHFAVPFAECSETYRVEALKAVEHLPAFTMLQRLTIRHLYDDVELWQAFGYEGAAVHLGGYVNRGFNDLDWLPDIPEESTSGSAS